MLSIEIKLGKAQMKYFKWHNANSPSNYHELTGKFRNVILLMMEKRYDVVSKSYRKDQYHESLTESVTIRICEENQKAKFKAYDQSFFIPANKMIWFNNFIYDLILSEINLVVDAHIAVGAKVNNAVFSVYDKYDIEESELNYDSVLKQNIRYRAKSSGVIHLPRRNKRGEKSYKK